MSRHIVTAALILILFGACARRDEQAKEFAREREKLLATYGQPGETWLDLKRDLAGGRFSMAWRYRGAQVAFGGQPVFDLSHNPILVSIYGTPIWCHVALSSSELAEVQNYRTKVDSFTVTLLGRVESVNWYTKHVMMKSLETRIDGGQ